MNYQKNSKKDWNGLLRGERRLKSSKKVYFYIDTGSIIMLCDLIQGMVISGSQDLFEYSLIFIGFILCCVDKGVEPLG